MGDRDKYLKALGKKRSFMSFQEVTGKVEEKKESPKKVIKEEKIVVPTPPQPEFKKESPKKVIKEEKIVVPTPPQPEFKKEFVKETVQESTDRISQYADKIKDNRPIELVIEKDLQNTPASMADLRNVTKSIQNIQTALTSLGGGGLGERDVLKLITDNPINLTDSDLDFIVSQIDDEFTDSSEVIQLIEEHVPLIVDSDYIMDRVTIDPAIDFKGIVSVADSDAPTSPVSGDLYVSDSDEIANATWVGVAGQLIVKQHGLVWSEADSSWHELGQTAIDTNIFLEKTGGTMTGQLSIYRPYEGAQSLAIGKSGQTRIRVHNNGEMKWSSSASDARLNRDGGNFTISVDNDTYMKFDRDQDEIEVAKTLSLTAPDKAINLPNNSDVGELQSNSNRRLYWDQNNVGIDVPLITNDNSITVGNGDVIVGSNGQIVTNKLNSTSNLSIFRDDEEKLRISSVTTTSYHALAYGSDAMTQVEEGGNSFLVHKGYVESLFAKKTDVDKCVSKTSTSDQSMKANLISEKDITAKKLKAVLPSGTADTAIIIAEGYRSGTGGPAARLTLSNSYNSDAYGTLEIWGTSGTTTYFKFNKDVDLNTNGLHGVKQIRMTGTSKTIGEGTTERIKLDSRVEILRIGNTKDGFKIHGTDDTGTDYPNGLLSVYHNDNTEHDAVNYVGKMVNNSNIVNKGYVDSAIASSIASLDDPLDFSQYSELT